MDGKKKANERSYAERDLNVFLACGAAFVPSLTLRRNPWGSLLMQLNLDKLRGFCGANQWLAAAFIEKDD